jgi:hypothetical protein
VEIPLGVELVCRKIDEDLRERQDETVRVRQAVAEVRLRSRGPATARARAEDGHGLVRQD